MNTPFVFGILRNLTLATHPVISDNFHPSDSGNSLGVSSNI